jgi:FMN phosphatase YigB (HAD superfamily)
MKRFISENNIKNQSISGRKIFVDFDDSLFNTKKFRDNLIKVFLKNGVTKKDFFATYYDYPEKTVKGLKKYDPKRQIMMLKRKLGIDDIKLKNNLTEFIKDTKKYVFSDIRDFLKGIKKKNLFIISYGYTDFQYKKIKNSGLYAKFEKIIITDNDKNKTIQKFVKKGETFIFIDDRIENINLVKKYFPASTTFLLKRKEGRYNDKKTKAVDFEIKNLKQAKNIIKNKIEKQKS